MVREYCEYQEYEINTDIPETGFLDITTIPSIINI